METIVLDANVLHSNLLRGLFLWMSKSNNLCRPVWSAQIWDEVFRNHLTFNLRDFPADCVEAVGVKSVHPDEFLCDLYGAKKVHLNSALLAHLKNLTQTKPTKASFIGGFRKAHVPKFSACLTKEDAAGNLFPEVWT